MLSEAGRLYGLGWERAWACQVMSHAAGTHMPATLGVLEMFPNAVQPGSGWPCVLPPEPI